MNYKAACRTVASRKATQKLICDLAARVGAEVEVTEFDVRDISLDLRKGSHAILINIDATVRGMTMFLGHWYTRNGATFPSDFPCDSINTYHYGKATVMEATLAEFIKTIERGFQRLAEIEVMGV
jgi:hypothetical protein